MSVINWDEKPYPWNEIGREWVEELQKLVTEPLEAPVVQFPPLPVLTYREWEEQGT